MGPTDDADLYKSGIHLLMDDITADSCKDAIEFILKQNIEKKKQKRLQFLICSNGGEVPSCFALIDVMRGSEYTYTHGGVGCHCIMWITPFITGEKGA